ncbi:FecR family protein [Chitinophaga cymbidii]|uniref:Iron dicitrate transporter FecR n=1 Tax=Chitinophaga cymbidii TaxID=1096750 RepID=A0A512RE21_9BACT|nr:FecR family protein [Chitinophaga cymbidii]GEP93956.1 iron dicitrate transporter FecR [Chitinophaga cymbidii]
MDTDNFKKLIDQYISGTLNDEGKAALRKLLDDPRYVRELEQVMDRQLEASAAGGEQYPEVADRIKTAIEAKIREEARVRRMPVRRTWPWAAAAAAVVLLLGGALFTGVFRNEKTLQQGIPTQTASVTPGSTKAVLTLADGSTITLDSSGNRVIQQGVATIRQNAGALEYAASGRQATTSYNILTTPTGGQYQLTLPDGSRIWLNASSSLRFPTTFSGSERIVELKGEAYFEIAKDMNMPFKVKVNNDMEVAVLGTHFNIMAYADESHVTTTLLEGAVKVLNRNKEVLLNVGQQALFNHRTKDLKVTPGDVEGAVAWKNSYFKFTDESIQSVMRKIARWYDVEVEYRGNVNQKALWGTISRFENITEVLQMLELTGTMHFSMEGRKVIVSQK